MGAFAWIAWSVTLGLIIHALVQYRKGGSAVDPDAGNATAPTTAANTAPSGAQKMKWMKDMMRMNKNKSKSKSRNKEEKDGVDGVGGGDEEGFMGILSAPLGGHDIEMFGGGQKPQPERLELNLPDPVHHASGPHTPQPQPQPQPQDPFRLPSRSDAPVASPSPADFGGRL